MQSNSVISFLRQMSKPYKWYVFGTIMAMCIIAADSNIKPYLIKTIINVVGDGDYSNIWIIVGIFASSQLAMVGAWAFFVWCSSRYVPQITGHIITHMIEKLNGYPYQYFQDHQAGDVVAKINNAAQRAPQVINTIAVEMLQLAITAIISVILLASVNIWFGMAIIGWITVFMLVLLLSMRRAAVLSTDAAKTEASIGGLLVDYFSNIFSVKLFTTQNYEIKLLDSKIDDYTYKTKLKILYLKTFFTRQGLIYSVYILSCLCGMIYLVQRDWITAGDFALIFILNAEIVSRLFHLSGMMSGFMGDWGAIQQSLTVLDYKSQIVDKNTASNLQISQGKIDFNNVNFSYPAAEELFTNKSVTIEPGTKVGLVGYSGGGKTTFVNLILRFYDVSSGAVLIDSQDVRDVTQESLRANIAMIPQDPTLFHRSLMDNIRYGNIYATDDDVRRAAKQAHADEFISKLPQGYDTFVGERGVKLSGGQRQRIAIARAFLKNAPILILDEATSQLDSITEKEIQQTLWDLMRDKTALVIAHRLSTLLRMDRILVFESGKIIEDGTHNELLAKGGLYKNMWDAQVGGLLPEIKA